MPKTIKHLGMEYVLAVASVGVSLFVSVFIDKKTNKRQQFNVLVVCEDGIADAPVEIKCDKIQIEDLKFLMDYGKRGVDIEAIGKLSKFLMHQELPTCHDVEKTTVEDRIKIVLDNCRGEDDELPEFHDFFEDSLRSIADGFSLNFMGLRRELKAADGLITSSDSSYQYRLSKQPDGSQPHVYRINCQKLSSALEEMKALRASVLTNVTVREDSSSQLAS